MSSTMKYAKLDLGTVEAVFNKLGGPEGAQSFLRGNLEIVEPEREWRGEEPMVIRFSVTSDGTTGAGWVDRLEQKGFRLSRYAKDVLMSEDFEPTNGVTYDIAVLVGALWNDGDRITKKIRATAEGRELTDPHPEVACLIREKFSDEELEAMGLWWIVCMHTPIKDSDGGPDLLGASRRGDGRWLDIAYDDPGSRWGRDGGFAFVVSQAA